jgi:hypothetical protein
MGGKEKGGLARRWKRGVRFGIPPVQGMGRCRSNGPTRGSGCMVSGVFYDCFKYNVIFTRKTAGSDAISKYGDQAE